MSARRIGERSSSKPFATSEPTGPIPRLRIVMKPQVAVARSKNARAPPTSAFRQVNSHRGAEPARSGAVPLGGGPTAGRAGAVAADPGASESSRASEPPDTGPPTPSCTNAVASTIGNPSTRRMTVKGSTQGGRARLSAIWWTTWSATHEAARYTPITCQRERL
jgi:hypothetical protein